MAGPLREELERWGFSDAAIDVYLAVLEVGQGRASEIADRADVSTRHVYRISEHLEDLGLVDVMEQVQPTTVRATPPDEVASVVRQSHETLLSEIEQRYEEPPERKTDVELLKRKPTVIDRSREIVTNAERWVVLVAPRNLLELLADDLRETVERGVLVLVLTDDETEMAGHLPEDLGTVVRVREDIDELGDFGLAVDYTRSLIVTPDAGAGGKEQYSPALYIEEENITARINGSMLANEWRLGEERVLPDPAPLPHSFDVFPKALIHAALHSRDGTDLYATVEARSIDDGTTTTVAGDVVDIRQGLVEPHAKSFLFEQSMVVDTGEETVSVAGPGAKLEDFAVESLRLERADEY